MPDQTPPHDWDDDADEPGYCDACCNTGEVDCYCGGDLCICGDETRPCPQCHGDGFDH